MTKTWISSAVLCVGLLGMAGCTHKQPGSEESAEKAAHTYGAGQEEALAERDIDAGGAEAVAFAQHIPGKNETYYFAFDRADLDGNEIQEIIAQAHYLLKHSGARVRLEGNTDNIGSREYNIALGYRRARAVAQVLEQQGISRAQIAIVSYGEEKPAAQGNSEAARAKNRRVNLVYEAH